MQTAVTFKSDRFRPILPEDAQVNPGRYGAELAFWLSKSLMAGGIATSYPNHEDWGWFIEYITNDGDEFWLCCGNVEGSDNEWHCFLDPKRRGLFGTSRPAVEAARPLLEALKLVLDVEPSITNVEWEVGS